MENLLLEEKYILEYIKDMLNDCKMNNNIYINNNVYHHNSPYKYVPSIIENGIHSIKKLNIIGVRPYSNEQLNLMDDIESHVNGIDGISLSKEGLTDLYPNEDEYDHKSPYTVDILVSDKILVSRLSFNYGNEFISYESIMPDKFRSIDIRMLKLLEDKVFETPSTLIEKFNNLNAISSSLIKSKLDIPLREMSYVDSCLDVEKLSKTSKIVLKP